MKTKEYIRPIPATWWMKNRYVFLFMLRELTSLFVVGYAVFLLVCLYRCNQGKESFAQFFEGPLRSPLAMLWHVLALSFVIYHSVTSWNAAPAIMVVRRGEDKVNPLLLVGAHYTAWAVVSIIVLVSALWASS